MVLASSALAHDLSGERDRVILRERARERASERERSFIDNQEVTQGR
jgi:hypothetical protein